MSTRMIQQRQVTNVVSYHLNLGAGDAKAHHITFKRKQLWGYSYATMIICFIQFSFSVQKPTPTTTAGPKPDGATESSDNSSVAVILGICLLGILILASCIVFAACCYRRRKKQRTEPVFPALQRELQRDVQPIQPVIYGYGLSIKSTLAAYIDFILCVSF